MSAKNHRSSIRDVAKAAKVSIATVSRVINHPELTSPQIQSRVFKAIKECNYITNDLKINDPVKNIAFFSLDISNPFYILVVKELLSLTSHRNINLIIYETSDFESEKKSFEHCLRSNVDGIIYSAGYSREEFKLGANCSIPIALIDHDCFIDMPAYSISSDNDKMLQLLINYLYHLGHRKIAFLYTTENTTIHYRLDAYIKYIKAYDLNINKNFIYQSFKYGEDAGIEAFDYFYSLTNPPTAVIASNDQVAHGFIMRALSLGIKIPEDFSVCGIDGIDGFYYPSITSVRQNIHEIAKNALDYVLNPSSIAVPYEKKIDVTFKLGMTCRKLLE